MIIKEAHHTHYGRNVICPSCCKRRDVRWRKRTKDFRCKCGATFTHEESLTQPPINRESYYGVETNMGRKQKVFEDDVITELNRNPGQTMCELAANLDVQPRTLRIHVKRLVEKQEIKERPDWRDMRRITYEPSPLSVRSGASENASAFSVGSVR